VTFCFDLVAVRNPAGTGGGTVPSNDARTVPGCVDLSEAADTARRPM
jgi:hypothetical protein